MPLVGYVLSPLTVRDVSAMAVVTQLFGPKAVKAMLPPARAPFVALIVPPGPMPFVPGSLAVPSSVAESLSVLPTKHGLAEQLAW